MSEPQKHQAVMGQSIRSLGLPNLDYWLLGAALFLVCFGAIMVASASMTVTVSDRLTVSPMFYVYRHLFALALGLGLSFVLFRLPMATWNSLSPLLLFSGVLMLIMVLMPGVGKTVNGATRWISLGVFNLQGSEFVKLFMILYLAGYLVRRQDEVASTIKGFAKPMLLLIATSSLLLMQPDFGTLVVVFTTSMGMLFLGGVMLIQFAVLVGLALFAGGLLVYMEPYRLDRIISFSDPWKDPYNSGYQLSQALIAFGRGEVTGVGLGNGIQKQFYLPEAHTDFIMAVIGEEFGLIGTLAVILLFVFITWRAFSIGRNAERNGQRFSAYVAYGVGLVLALQAIINIGVNVGVLPTKGLTLPLMSYGSNSIIVACLAVMLLLRIDYEWRNHRSGSSAGGVPWSSV